MKQSVAFYLTCILGFLGMLLYAVHPGHKKKVQEENIELIDSVKVEIWEKSK